MNFDFENGLPVWVWGILFFVVVIPFSFRPGADDGANLGPNITTDSIQQTGEIPTVLPTLTSDPNATVPVIIEIAPEIIEPGEDYPSPEEPEVIEIGEGYN